MAFWRRKKYKYSLGGLTPDEVFLDAENINNFSRERFEGVIEKPLDRKAFQVFGGLILLFGLVLFGRVFWLEIARGQEFFSRSQNNYIRKTYIDSPRGIIFDRRGEQILTNEAYTDADGSIRYRRKVRHAYAFSHVLGFLKEVSPEDLLSGSLRAGIKEMGKDGIEKFYNDKLEGIPGERDEELDASGNVLSRSPLIPPREGGDIKLTLDAELQENFWRLIEEISRSRGFRGGAGIIFSVKDGAILSMVSLPSFDLNAFSADLTSEEASQLFQDPEAPFFNRALSGAHIPGSIIKPFVAIAALEEGIIDPEKSIYSSGSLVLPNPFDNSKPSIFLDWKAHGYVNMRQAIAVSSDVYFYTIGGGFEDIRGLGIRKLKEWFHKFGFDTPTGIDVPGEETGFLPDPEWKAKTRPWRIGDTYHVSIGQGDLLLNPIGVVRALGFLATRGAWITPHLLQGASQNTPPDPLYINEQSFTVVAEGMRHAAQAGGTASALSWLPFPVAAKTGTAELGKKDRVNSWFIGYAPYDQPEIGMVIFLESGPRANLIGSPYVASETFKWILDNGGLTRFGTN